MPEPHFMEHVKDDVAWKWATGIIGALWTVIVALAGVLYYRDQSKFKLLFAWKDEVIRDYIRVDRCDRRHDELMDQLKELLREQRHARRLLEKHLGVNGEVDGP